MLNIGQPQIPVSFREEQAAVYNQLYLRNMEAMTRYHESMSREKDYYLVLSTDYKVAAKAGVCNFLSTYLPMSIAFGIGAGLAQSGVNIANRVNGPR